VCQKRPGTERTERSGVFKGVKGKEAAFGRQGVGRKLQGQKGPKSVKNTHP